MWTTSWFIDESALFVWVFGVLESGVWRLKTRFGSVVWGGGGGGGLEKQLIF